MNRILTITINSDWKHNLREAAIQAQTAIETGQYQGESLNFPTPALFFSRLSANRWRMINHLLGGKTVGIRALARQLGRDVRRVHEDATVLVELGLLEKTNSKALCCPYSRIHIDMVLEPSAQERTELAEAA